MQKLKRPGLLSRIESTLQPLLLRVSHTLTQLGDLRRFLMMAALIGLSVLVLLLSCACTPRIVKPSLPAQADPRPIPEWQGKTYRDLTNYVEELRESCVASEADKTAIREAFGNE